MPHSLLLRPPGGATGKVRKRYAIFQKILLIKEAGCGLSIFCSMCCRKREVRHKTHRGPTRACRGSPESSLQCENNSGVLPRPTCRNKGEKEAPHLSCTWNRLITLDFKKNSCLLLMPRRCLCPGKNGISHKNKKLTQQHDWKKDPPAHA
jgi:hypothetical protein